MRSAYGRLSANRMVENSGQSIHVTSDCGRRRRIVVSLGRCIDAAPVYDWRFTRLKRSEINLIVTRYDQTFRLNIAVPISIGVHLRQLLQYGMHGFKNFLLVMARNPVKALLMSGFLGGFTTFSAFSLDLVTLAERNAWNGAFAYLLASVGLSVAALLFGLWLTRAALG